MLVYQSTFGRIRGYGVGSDLVREIAKTTVPQSNEVFAEEEQNANLCELESLTESEKKDHNRRKNKKKNKRVKLFNIYTGQIFVVVGHDDNNTIYPIAYAMVEAERLDT